MKKLFYILLFSFPAFVSADTVTLFPNGIGNFDLWALGTPSSVTKYNAATTSDGDASYISETASSEAQTFAFPGALIPAGSSINSVTLNAVARVSAGVASTTLRVEKGLTAPDISDGSYQDLVSSYATSSRTMTTNPFTGLAWTLAEVNTWPVNFGVVYNDGGSGHTGRVTQVYIVVNYTPAEAVDDTPPVITLLGTTPLDLAVGAQYTDAGAAALDNVDGNITANIVVGGTYSTTTSAGTFSITYNVSDAAGNAATQVVRTIIVSEEDAPPPPPDGSPTLEELIASLKQKVKSLDVRHKLKKNLLQQIRKIERKIERQKILVRLLSNLANKINKKNDKGKINDPDAQAIIDLLEKIEDAL